MILSSLFFTFVVCIFLRLSSCSCFYLYYIMFFWHWCTCKKFFASLMMIVTTSLCKTTSKLHHSDVSLLISFKARWFRISSLYKELSSFTRKVLCKVWEISYFKINKIWNSSITIRLKHYILVGLQTTLYIIVCLKTFGRREENFYSISILLIYKTTKNILNFQNDRGIFHKNIYVFCPIIDISNY